MPCSLQLGVASVTLPARAGNSCVKDPHDSDLGQTQFIKAPAKVLHFLLVMDIGGQSKRQTETKR